jgi:hypothetical protein
VSGHKGKIFSREGKKKDVCFCFPSTSCCLYLYMMFTERDS